VLRGATAAEKLRGPMFGCLGPNTGALAGVCGRGRPISLWESGVLPPENFLKTQMLNPAFW